LKLTVEEANKKNRSLSISISFPRRELVIYVAQYTQEILKN